MVNTPDGSFDYAELLRPWLSTAVKGFFAGDYQRPNAIRALRIVPSFLVSCRSFLFLISLLIYFIFQADFLTANPRAIFDCPEVVRFCYTLSRMVDERPDGEALPSHLDWYIARQFHADVRFLLVIIS